MKKTAKTLFALFLLSPVAMAQTGSGKGGEVLSIDDIVGEQQTLTYQKTLEQHYEKVWGRRSFTNFNFSTLNLDPKEDIPTGVNNGLVPKYKSNWGASLVVGRNYRLHKKPIANVLQFCIDYTGIDLNVSHIDAEGDGKNLYDSSNKYTPISTNTNSNSTSASDQKYYIPWNLEKYEADYGMRIGPSLTIAPFTGVHGRGAHFLKLNFYYHIGYQGSVLYMVNDEKADVNQGTTSQAKTNHDDLKDNTKLNWGHGMTQTFGFSLSWKGIGFGFESRKASLKYKSASTGDFGKDSYKFDSSLSRIYLQYRY